MITRPLFGLDVQQSNRSPATRWTLCGTLKRWSRFADSRWRELDAQVSSDPRGEDRACFLEVVNTILVSLAFTSRIWRLVVLPCILSPT